MVSDDSYTCVGGGKDDLDKISKQHGLKDGNAIWKAAANKALVSKRGTPEKLQKGDKLTIPPNEEALKHIDGLIKALANNVSFAEKKVKLWDHLIKEDDACTEAVLTEMRQALSEMETKGTQVDFASLILTMTTGLAKCAISASRGLAAGTSDLKAITESQEKSLAGIKSFALAPTMFAGGRIAKANFGGTDTVDDDTKKTKGMFQLVVTGATQLMALTSPSGLGNSIAQLKEGKSLSEAFWTKFGGDIKQQIKAVEDNHKKRQEHFKAAMKASTDAQHVLESKLKEAEAAAKAMKG